MPLFDTIHVPERVRKLVEHVWLEAPAWHSPPNSVVVRPGVGGGASRLRIIAFGDLLLGRNLPPTAAEVFGDMLDTFRSADLRTGNLEGVLTARQKSCNLIGSFVRADPARLPVLTDAGFDVLTVANNHLLDFGLDSLVECLSMLHRAGIQTCGLDTSPVVVNVRGCRIGILGFCDDYSPAGTQTTPGPALADLNVIVQAIERCRADVDILILHLHQGYEFGLHPLLLHRDQARRYAELGADIVLCHHAHVPMGLEAWKGRLIAYGLGNGAFPSNPYLRSGHKWVDRSFFLEIEACREGVHEAKLHPYRIAHSGAVRLLSGRVRSGMLAAFARMSSRLNDTSWLSQVERHRMIYEAGQQATNIVKDSRKSDAALQARALTLCMPRQQTLIRYLSALDGSAGPELASTLSNIGAAATCPTAVRETYKRSAGCLQDHGLRQHPSWSDSLRWRVP